MYTAEVCSSSRSSYEGLTNWLSNKTCDTTKPIQDWTGHTLPGPGLDLCESRNIAYVNRIRAPLIQNDETEYEYEYERYEICSKSSYSRLSSAVGRIRGISYKRGWRYAQLCHSVRDILHFE